MSIQWYPGHMTKARRELAELMPKQDVIIEVLDARMPAASENPVLAELRGDKPCLKVLNKSDLADPAVTKAWLRYFERGNTDAGVGEDDEAPPPRPSAAGRVRAIALSANQAGDARTRIPAMCKALAIRASGPGKTVRAMIVGIPNVGKSTLTNTLMERKVAKVGDEPAVTKARQQVVLKNGMALSDNPGILWPKIEDEAVSYRLALGGAIPDTALDYESVALFAARFFMQRYPELVRARYKLESLPPAPDALLAEIGRRRGCLRAGGAIDMHKAADVVVHEFRAGLLGRVSLEEPPDDLRE
jgi:ribosome biogenesis GTPase A